MTRTESEAGYVSRVDQVTGAPEGFSDHSLVIRDPGLDYMQPEFLRPSLEQRKRIREEKIGDPLLVAIANNPNSLALRRNFVEERGIQALMDVSRNTLPRIIIILLKKRMKRAIENAGGRMAERWVQGITIRTNDREGALDRDELRRVAEEIIGEIVETVPDCWRPKEGLF